MREHYYRRLIQRRVPPPAIHTAYRRAQIDRTYTDKLCELLLPFVAAIGDNVAGHLGEDDRDDIISELTIILWRTAPSLLEKEFPTGVSILSYLSRKLRPEAYTRLGMGMSEVVEIGVDQDPVAGTVESSQGNLNYKDQREWTKEYVKRNIRFVGPWRGYCIRLITRGRYALHGTVDPDEEKFLIDYVSVLSRMGYREYAEA
jgi:hypothetical protein